MTDPQQPRVMRVSTRSEAREACLDQYAAAYEVFATKEQEYRVQNRLAEAEGAHRYAVWVLRAYEAEAR